MSLDDYVSMNRDNKLKNILETNSDGYDTNINTSKGAFNTPSSTIELDLDDKDIDNIINTSQRNKSKFF